MVTPTPGQAAADFVKHATAAIRHLLTGIYVLAGGRDPTTLGPDPTYMSKHDQAAKPHSATNGPRPGPPADPSKPSSEV